MAAVGDLMRRTHVVMIPGFGGFDGLGQLSYYTGVTELFQRLAHPGAVLHYFDNLPTAAVATRARALARFLEKLDERRVVQGDDELVLVGHSTGGLDIRQLLRDLADHDPHRLLPRVRRLVFLSVPQYGTNIADWVRAHGRIAHLLVALFRRAVGLPVAIPLAPVEWLLSWVAPGHPQLLDAVADAGRDMQPDDAADPLAQADAHAAAAEIALWLEDIDDDFLAIRDLSVGPVGDRVVDTPERDVALWKRTGIRTQSYATRGRPPFDHVHLGKPDHLARPLSLLRAAHADLAGTDAVYRLAYTACATGPFRVPGDALAMRRLDGSSVDVHSWDNDGVVNTASERSLNDDPCFVVDGDHADIIGHYRLHPEHHPELARHARRRYESYDLLGSDAAGTFHATFEQVWQHALGFALGLRA